MSIICLSSRGLSDSPANYSNYFGGRGVQFPKNSEVCLVGGSVQKHQQGGVILNITPETNTMAIHYGTTGSAVDDNLFRDDVIVVDPISSDYTDVAERIELSLKKQMSMSPLRYGGTSTIVVATGWTFELDMFECRNTLPGYWGAPENLPIESPLTLVNGASSTRVTPTAGTTCWAEDTRKLWNTDNNATAGNFATQLEGAKFSFVWATGVPASNFEGMQGGIVTGDRLVDPQDPGSWVNCPVEDDEDNPDLGAFQQRIDLGYEIKGRAIEIFKNTFDSTAGYTRRIVGTIAVPVAGADQLITILFRPCVAGTNAGWEVATKIAGAAFVGLPRIPGTPKGGNFPIGLYNGNAEGYGVGLNAVQFWGKNNDIMVEIAGCYDDDDANATAIAPAKRFFNRMVWGFSYISDDYMTSSLQYDFRRLCQTRCQIAQALGFYPGGVVIVANSSTGVESDNGTARWNQHDAPFCIQLPNLPITGYLGGGSSIAGGATALPILGIIDGYLEGDNPTNSVYEPCNENWVRLINQDSFMVNEIQVRITDLYGIVPQYLDNPTHIWIKIRSGSGLEKI